MTFTLNIIPPTVTAQEHKVRCIRVGNRYMPQFYDTPKLKAARNMFESVLEEYTPNEPYAGPVMLRVEWRFAYQSNSHKEGEWRSTRPDTDNLQKLLKDCMTRTGYWKDDSQVALETVSKWWSKKNPGITITVENLT